MSFTNWRVLSEVNLNCNSVVVYCISNTLKTTVASAQGACNSAVYRIFQLYIL